MPKVLKIRLNKVDVLDTLAVHGNHDTNMTVAPVQEPWYGNTHCKKQHL